MKQLGKRNATRDARDMAVMLQTHGMRTTSALDYWDQLVTLHYGKRHGPIDHFRQTAIANLAETWAWAGAPFGAPAQYEITNSLLRVNCDMGERAFLYYRIASVPTGCKVASVALGLSNNTAGIFCGLRLDDGSDNNYVEVVLYLSSTTPDVWTVRRRYRTGGGAVATDDGSAMTIPTAMVLHMHLDGTPYASWDVDALLHTPMGIGGTMRAGTGQLTGITFAPTRCGLVFDNSADDGSQNWMIADWIDIDSDDAWMTP
jgi:hypothetical protein